MSTVQDQAETNVGRTALSGEERRAALERAVAGFVADGWRQERKLDFVRVLVGHNGFRTVLVRRRFGIHDRRQLVEVDTQGNVSIRPV